MKIQSCFETGHWCRTRVCMFRAKNRTEESVQFRNCLALSKNSRFAAPSWNSYLAEDDSEIVPAQSRNRDKVRISILVHVFIYLCKVFFSWQ